MWKKRRASPVDEDRRIIGLKDYYVTQLTTLIARILACFLLSHFDLNSINPQLPMAINIVVAIITVTVSLMLLMSYICPDTNTLLRNSQFLSHGDP